MVKMLKSKRIINTVLSLIILVSAITMVKIPSFAVEDKSGDDPNQYETWMQTVYSRNEGLTVGTANAIATTSDGIIWIGTYAGLYRYNGSKFQLMNQYESVKSVECLFVDDKDRLWVGTNDNGISIFKDEELLCEIHQKDGLPSDAVRSIVESSNGTFYIGTSDAMALIEFDENVMVKGILDEVVYADRITADYKGNVVATSSYGNIYLINDGKVLAESKLDNDDRYTACTFDVSGHVYVGTSLGDIYIYDINSQKFKQLFKVSCEGVRKVNNLIRINSHTIFVCADNGIGYIDDKQVYHHLETPNFNSNIYNVIMDYQGNLWFSSSRMGLLRLCKTSFVDMFTEYSIDPTVVNSIERYDDCIYAGSDVGLYIIDEVNRETIKNELTEYLDGVRIRKILKDKRNHLWFCTYGEGLVEYDGEAINNIDEAGDFIGGRVRTAIELSNGRIAVSSEKGIAILYRGELEKLVTEADGLKNLINLCMLEREDGDLLIGSDGDGIAEYKDGQVNIISVEDGLPSGVILRMVKDKKGDGSFVVTSNSLCYLNPDNTITQLNNFPYSNNYDVVQNEDIVFVLGSAGIYVVGYDELLANNEDMKYTYLDSRAGLQTALVANSWGLFEENKIYLATSSGATLFDLTEYEDRPSDFLMRVSSIVIDGVEQSFDDIATLSFSDSVRRLEIKPEIINYSTVDPVVSCNLNGFDLEPIVMSQSELSPVVYTNLPAGKYTFSMELIDSQSGVSVSKRAYYLERETAFTETVWFYLLIFAGLLLLAALIGLIIAKKSYNSKMSKKTLESNIYLEALKRNATFLYYFDLTQGYITEDIRMNNGYSAVEKLGLTLPVLYDEFRTLYYERMNIRMLESSESSVYREDLIKAFESGKTTVSTEYYSETYDKYHRNNIYMTKDEETGHIIAIVVGSDSTEQRKIEEEKKQELERAYAEASQASRAKTDFLSRMSHDIRTPINGIVGMVYLMEKNIDDKLKVMDGLKKVKNLSHQLELLINDVLEMSRIESGKMELSSEQFDLEEVLHEIAPTIKTLADARDVVLTGSHYDIKHTSVIGSPVHIQRIFTNILSNAIKYNHPGGSVECWLKESKLDEKHSNYTFTIKDSGIGMSEDFTKHIFEPFSREEENLEGTSLGTGLGMAITKEIVDKMGGSIEVDSKKGVGTCFTITLPLELSEEEIVNEAIVTGQSLEGLRILLVDDSQINREVAQFMLEDKMANVETASNGKEAVEVFSQAEEGRYDLILMDIMMPELNGLEATKAIRGLGREDAKEIPIIAMTANAFEEDVKKCHEAGMNDHLAKPVTPEDLIRMISKWRVVK